MATARRVELYDFEPRVDGFLEEVLQGLSQPRKSIPCKYFYDERGSQLFDKICELDEYYPTRIESGIMRDHVSAMVRLLGSQCLLIEYGSGSSTKTRILLDHLLQPAGYVPLDISREHLLQSAAALSAAYPNIPILPVCADYTSDFELPHSRRPVRRIAVYFPGSTIGNFEPAAARRFLRQIATVCGAGGALLIGVDLKKPRAVLEPAYNDSRGVTAAFNINLLLRINRELDGNFQPHQFSHDAPYNEREGRIEMHLVSRQPQLVHISGRPITFAAGERIITEYSYKYSLAEFAQLAAGAGFSVQQVWTDADQLFSVQYLTLAQLRPDL